MEPAPRNIQTLVASFLVLSLGLPGSAGIYPDLRRETLRAQAAPQAAGLEQLDRTLRAAAGMEERVPELSLKLKDAGRAFEELSKIAARLADLGGPEALGALKAVLADERMPAKNRGAAAMGLGLHGDAEHLKELPEALISVGALGQSKKAVATIAQSLTWLNYERFSDVEFVSDLLEKVQGHSGINLSEARTAVAVHGARLNYQEVLAGRPLNTAYIQALSKTPGGQAVLTQLQAEPQQRKAWAAAQLGKLKTPFAIPALRQILETALDQDPQSGDPGTLNLQVAAAVSLSQAMSANAGLLDHGPMVRRLKQEAIDFSLRRLAPEGIPNVILRQAMEIHWQPIWKSRPAAGTEERFAPRTNIIPVVTPLTRAQGLLVVDEGVLPLYMEYLKGVGASALLLAGATGEFHRMDKELRQSAIGLLTEAARGKFTVFTHISGADPRETLENASIAKQRGADVLVIAPLFYLSDPVSIAQHVDDLIQETGLPVALYNNPGLPGLHKGINIPPEVVKKLWGNGKIVAIKDSSGDLGLLKAYVATGVPVYQGDEGHLFDALEAGARGTVGSSGNVWSLLQQMPAAPRGTMERTQQHLLLFRDDLTVNRGKIPAGLKYRLSKISVRGQPLMERTLALGSPSLSSEEEKRIDAIPGLALAGAEQVRPISTEAFFGEYHPALTTLPVLRKEEIFRWMDYGGFEVREVILPDRVPLYVRGKELMEELSARIGNPPGVSFDWKLLPLKPAEAWERAGLILNDLDRQGSYDFENPNGLRIRDVRSGESGQLTAAVLLADALASLPTGSVLLGAELLSDTQGRVRLILFSA